MSKKNSSLEQSSRIDLFFLLAFALVILSYSNTFNASWHFDDFPNIVYNTKLHLKELSIENIRNTFFASPVRESSSDLYRPLSCLTFALNWYIGKDAPVGYHIVNLILHLVAAFFLYKTIYLLLLIKKVSFSEKKIHLFALFSATLWAVHPIQTQAVTYIVQRMAVMGAMFFVSSIFFYLKARTANQSRSAYIFFFLSIICYFAAIASKENTVTLPCSLILIEAVFFQKISRKILFILFGVVALSLLIISALGSEYFLFLSGYEHRSFNLSERVLTEHRILLFYLSLLFVPAPQRFSLIHNVTTSVSILEPWTTLPVIICIYLIILFSIYSARKYPLFSFALLFYFTNHLVESTIVPLELLYEHRNYLPSMFLFLPISTFVFTAWDAVKDKRVGKPAIIFFISFLLINLSFATFLRNKIWHTKETLWSDTLKKADKDPRPYSSIASIYAEKKQYDKALKFYQASLLFEGPSPAESKSVSYNNMGNIELEKRNIENALEYFNKAQKIDKGQNVTLINKTLALISIGNFEQALETILLFKRNNEEFSYENYRYYNLCGFIFLRLQQPFKALPYFHKAMLAYPNDKKAVINYAVALSQTAQYDKAENLLNKVRKVFSLDIISYLALIDNSIRQNNFDKIAFYKKVLEKNFSKHQVESILLADNFEKNRTIPFSSKLYALLLEKEN